MVETLPRQLWLLILVAAACHGNFPTRDGDIDGDGDSDSDGDIDGDSDSDSDIDGDGDSDSDADRDIDHDADGDDETDGDECLSRASTACLEGDLWWLDSCGRAEEIAEDCARDGAVCRGGRCCQPQQRSTCQDGDSWWVDSCGNVEELREACDDGLSCTVDRCDTSSGECLRVPDCTDAECVAAVAECQCRPVETRLTCGSLEVGSLAPGPDTTDLMAIYGRGCGVVVGPGDVRLDGHEMTYRFSHRDGGIRVVTVTLSSICGDELWGIALDGSFRPCDPSRCVARQIRGAPF